MAVQAARVQRFQRNRSAAIDCSPSYPQQMAAPASAPNAFLISWEEVLMPLQWMVSAVGLQSTPAHIQHMGQCIQRDASLRAAMQAIESQVFEALSLAASLGPVFLLTNESITATEALCDQVFPRVANAIRSSGGHVQVVAPSQKPMTSFARSIWRVDAVRNIVTDMYGGGPAAQLRLQDPVAGRFGLVYLGEAHQVLGGRITAVAPFVTTKFGLVTTERGHVNSLEAFHAQVQHVIAFIKNASNYGGPVEVNCDWDSLASRWQQIASSPLFNNPVHIFVQTQCFLSSATSP